VSGWGRTEAYGHGEPLDEGEAADALIPQVTDALSDVDVLGQLHAIREVLAHGDADAVTRVSGAVKAIDSLRDSLVREQKPEHIARRLAKLFELVGLRLTRRSLDECGEHAMLAQELFESGLLFLVNQAVLHHYGYALAVTVDPQQPTRVLGLALHATLDEKGVWFDEASIVAGREKLLRSGAILSRLDLAGRLSSARTRERREAEDAARRTGRPVD
jgi:hypothetical protein